MGATLRTFALRCVKSGHVRQTLVAWLRAKGFELSEGPVLFPFDQETERGLVLSENESLRTHRAAGAGFNRLSRVHQCPPRGESRLPTLRAVRFDDLPGKWHLQAHSDRGSGDRPVRKCS